MKSLIVCNIAENFVSEINLKDYSVCKYPLDLGQKLVGAHGIKTYCDKVVIANSKNDSISIFNPLNKGETDNIYVGSHPNDVVIYDNDIYVACGDINSIIVVNLENKKVEYSIKVGEFPHSVELDESNGVIWVCNMNGNSISLIDCNKKKVIKDIKGFEYPAKILISKDKKFFYLCESYLGQDRYGNICVFSAADSSLVQRIRVGGTPIDLYEEEEKLYVSNFNEGTISVIDIFKFREVKRIYVGGMPRGIVKNDNDIFISDYSSGKVIKVNLMERMIKTITVGKEPNAMILFDYPE